jgi:peptidoglycan hydrolase-like amidase
VGFCQIGAAVMAAKGFQAENILQHYFLGAELMKLY